MTAVLTITIICVLIYAAIFFLNPRFTIYLLIFFSVFDLGFFSRWIDVTRYFARIPYFLAILLGIRFLIDYLVKIHKIKKEDKIVSSSIVFIVLLMLTIFISGMYNNENIILGIYEVRYYLIFLIFIISFRYYKPFNVTEKNFILLCVIVGLIQIPFTALEYWLVKYRGVDLSQSSLDMSSGTFSSYSPLVFMQCVSIGSVLVYHFRYKKPLIKINNYMLSLILTIPLLLSFSRSSMGFVIATCFCVLLKDFVQTKNLASKVKNAMPMAISIIIIVLLFINFFWKQHFENLQQLNLDYVKSYFFRESKDFEDYIKGTLPVMGRGRAVVESFNFISEDNISIFIGKGSGSVSEASLLGKTGKYFQKYGQLAGIGRTQVSKIIAELGFAGLITYFLYILKIYVHVKKKSLQLKLAIFKDLYIVVFLVVTMLSFYSLIFGNLICMLVLSLLLSINQKQKEIND